MPVATGFQAVNPGENSAELWVDYNNAVSDSAIYRPERIHALFPLQVNGDSGKATVVTLTDWNYPMGAQSLTQAVWVTAAPEVQNKCRTFKDKDMALRLRQLLGLQPDAKVAHFVTMSVDYRDVFRPALNPIATTALLCDAQRDKKCGETFPDWVSDEHRRWITQQMLDSYMVLTPPSHCCSYPWTRLGYTYDWKRGEPDKYGASEYVVRPGALVNVQESRDYAAFCRARD
ncbi:MAG: hypothetical protein WA738_20780 [Candidatus Angelobacter sp.]